jgi:hypothetical protein
VLEGSAIGAGECAFIANHQVEAGSAGEVFVDVGDAVERAGHAIDVLELAINIKGAELDFIADQGGFDLGEAAEAPAGGDHGLDQFDFDGSRGGELVEIGIEETLEVGGGFRGEDDGRGRERGGAGGEAVAGGVLGGAGAAFGRDGAAGLGAIGAGGGGFGLR